MTKLAIIMTSILMATLSLVGCADMFVRQGSTPPIALIDTLRAQPDVQVVQLGDTLKIILTTDGCFDMYTSVILPRCKPTLTTISTVLNAYGNAPVTVAGYTDEVAPAQAAILLSKQQADSIVAYLWAHGDAYERFQTIGYGPQFPIATNLNPDDSYYNRRIEITVRRGGSMMSSSGGFFGCCGPTNNK